MSVASPVAQSIRMGPLGIDSNTYVQYRQMKRYLISAAIGGIGGFAFGLVVEGIFWLSITDDTFTWTIPKALGLIFACLGALEPLRHEQRSDAP